MDSSDGQAKKKRVKPTSKTRESVLSEFNHKCAICGKSKPTIHHIDEDPSNNAVDNLLPLCPNHHYSDQHDPTSPIDQRKLLLFRRHKDPLILSPEFEPLFRRVRFLLELNESTFEEVAAAESAVDLERFVYELEMGNYYGQAISNLVSRPSDPRITVIGDPSFQRREADAAFRQKYLTQLIDAVAPVLALVVELLRYQSWGWSPNSDRESL